MNTMEKVMIVQMTVKTEKNGNRDMTRDAS